MTEHKREKRGRPKKFSDEWYDFARAYATRAKTRRGQQDAIWAYKAMGAIVKEDFPNKRFLYSDDDKYICVSVLSQLGRMEDEELILHAAKLICKWALVTKETSKVKSATRLLRAIRLEGISEAASENREP